MSITKVYITIRTQELPGAEQPDEPVKEHTERLASGFLSESEAKDNVKLAKDVLEKIFYDAEFVED